MDSYKLIKNTYIDHLADQEIDEMMKMYYAGEKLNEILAKFKIQAKPSQIISILPRVQSDDECNYCQTKISATYQLRTRVTNEDNQLLFECPNCKHQPKNENCHCRTCKKIRLEQYEKDRELIIQRLLEPYKQFENNPVKLESISLRDKLMLSVLLRTDFDVALNLYAPKSSYQKKLFPQDSYLPRVIEDLTNKGILYPKEVFKITTQSNYVSLDFMQMTYKLNLDTTESELYDQVVKLIYLDREEFIHDVDFIASMWGFIFQEEILACIKYRLSTVKMYCTFTENAILRLKPYVDNCSISEMFSYVYFTVKSIVFYKAQGHYDSRNCESYVLNEIDRQYIKVQNQLFTKQEYSRPNDLPESILFEVFFGRLLKIDSKGFKTPLNDYLRKNNPNTTEDNV